jgi:hypothetical protein
MLFAFRIDSAGAPSAESIDRDQRPRNALRRTIHSALVWRSTTSCRRAHHALPERGGTGRATSHEDNDSLATNVIAAIESKLNSADSKMILVLDANDAPAYTDDPHVVEIARRTLSERGLLDRWAAVWLVGPTTRRTTRLDSEARPRQVNDRDVPPLSVTGDDPGE